LRGAEIESTEIFCFLTDPSAERLRTGAWHGPGEEQQEAAEEATLKKAGSTMYPGLPRKEWLYAESGLSVSSSDGRAGITGAIPWQRKSHSSSSSDSVGW
jgi:hypothetical protein